MFLTFSPFLTSVFDFQPTLTEKYVHELIEDFRIVNILEFDSGRFQEHN